MYRRGRVGGGKVGKNFGEWAMNVKGCKGENVVKQPSKRTLCKIAATGNLAAILFLKGRSSADYSLG